MDQFAPEEKFSQHFNALKYVINFFLQAENKCPNHTLFTKKHLYLNVRVIKKSNITQANIQREYEIFIVTF